MRFRYTEDYVRAHPATTDQEQVGFVAQEFEAVFPKSVSRGADGYLSVDVSPVTFHNTAAIRELNQKLEATVKEKDAELQSLKQSVAELKELVSKLAGQQNGGAK